jgi:hypothetical protein
MKQKMESKMFMQCNIKYSYERTLYEQFEQNLLTI